jgi:cysteine desulfurase / selenocysteine lyase
MSAPTAHRMDFARIREDFPGLARIVNGRPLVYFDNAATAQRPRSVIEAMDAYYETFNASVHRGVHRLSQEATEAFERARDRIRLFLNASHDSEIILTKGCTESLNLVAHSWRAFLKPGDEILLTTLEHHSNIVPWQLAAEATGAVVKPIPIDDSGAIRMEAYRELLSPRTKVVGIVHVSNALGVVNPVKAMAELAHEAGAVVVVDGAQAGPHVLIDVQDLGADFYALSGHKMYGPTGVGILYGRRDLLDRMPPYQGGGSMIKTVAFEGSTYADPPAKFEPGTPNIAGLIGLGAVVDYLVSLAPSQATDRERLGHALAAIGEREHELLDYGTRLLSEFESIRQLGTATPKCSTLSFVMEDVHPHDIGTVLDSNGVAVRAGHHCAMPLMERLGVPATVRASLAFYNTEAEIDQLAAGLRKVGEIFG